MNASHTYRFLQPGMRRAHNRSSTPVNSTVTILIMLSLDESISVLFHVCTTTRTAAASPMTMNGKSSRDVPMDRLPVGEPAADMNGLGLLPDHRDYSLTSRIVRSANGLDPPRRGFICFRVAGQYRLGRYASVQTANGWCATTWPHLSLSCSGDYLAPSTPAGRPHGD